MKVKTSITLSSDLLRAVDRAAQDGQSRSDFIEAAIRAYFAQMHRRQRDARDLEILNEHADRLNAEAEDVLAYQVIP
jgi:metal-responsive CopG/Arc/MetJ family transcriptional regulator